MCEDGDVLAAFRSKQLCSRNFRRKPHPMLLEGDQRVPGAVDHERWNCYILQVIRSRLTYLYIVLRSFNSFRHPEKASNRHLFEEGHYICISKCAFQNGRVGYGTTQALFQVRFGFLLHHRHKGRPFRQKSHDVEREWYFILRFAAQG